MKESEIFDKIVEDRLKKIKDTLGSKGSEYATGDDRFHNFNMAARKRGTTPEAALMGMKVKHDVSVDDLVAWAEASPERLTAKIIDEKILDSICYLLLLLGLLTKRIGGYCEDKNS